MNECKELLADWCGKCDEVNMIPQCEVAIYGGPTKTGQYHLYCYHCGTKVDFTTYWNNVSDEELAFWISVMPEVLEDIKASVNWYFNEAYINSRISILKRVIDAQCLEFAESKEFPNLYSLGYMTKMLWELIELKEEYEGKYEQHTPDVLSLGRPLDKTKS